jgi:hypothetical protein
LCYQDLRTPSKVATAVAAPLVEASVEPGPVRWAELRAWHGEVEEALVSEVSEVSEVSAGVEASTSDPAASIEEVAPDSAAAASSAELSWPCVCGAHVAFRGGSAGGLFAHRWSTSRAFRFIASGSIALCLAVGIPVLLALFG